MHTTLEPLVCLIDFSHSFESYKLSSMICDSFGWNGSSIINSLMGNSRLGSFNFLIFLSLWCFAPDAKLSDAFIANSLQNYHFTLLSRKHQNQTRVNLSVSFEIDVQLNRRTLIIQCEIWNLKIIYKFRLIFDFIDWREHEHGGEFPENSKFSNCSTANK